MNIARRYLAAVIGAAMLTGCTTISENEYKNAQAIIGGSPAIKRSVITGCIARQAARPLVERKSESTIMNASLASFPTTFCNRLWNAFAKGRITYADYQDLSSSTADHSKVIKIMQGR
ncbi:hypothetical protein NKG60_00020 [Mesorhizobium sp. M1428]|uniref:hypothetical protein n=1 Tax=unclassified Mesorhizobium TaxID=325217 RepID=UPI003339218F